MFHRHYKTETPNGMREFGILGECHLYSKTEEEFAKSLLRRYEILAYEEVSGYNSFLMSPFKFSQSLVGYFWNNLFGRQRFDLIGEAENQGLETVALEEDYYFGNLQAAGISLLSIISTPIGILTLLSDKIRGIDPITLIEKEMIEKIVSGDFRYEEIDFLLDGKNRDENMSRNVTKLITERPSRVLVRCGLGHFQGIEKKLTKEFGRLEKIDESMT